MIQRHWYVRTVHHSPEHILISGDTLEIAVRNNLRRLVRSATSFEHPIKDTELKGLFYSQGILGGKGGAVAEIQFYDMALERTEIACAWIYARESEV